MGEHEGLYNYTIGQRKGLGISNKVPLFVLGFNKKDNEVIVGEEKELYKKETLVGDINLLLVDEIDNEIEVEVKTRYSAKSAKAMIKKQDDNIRVEFYEPQRGITPRTICGILYRRYSTWRGKNYLKFPVTTTKTKLQTFKMARSYWHFIYAFSPFCYLLYQLPKSDYEF